ncbi:MAG: non-hydrolyzing UDP-N-acetylglucosamine 2-epimerase [Thiohalomonadales bacterium]
MTIHKVICVVGARPNFMKISPIMAQFNQTAGIEAKLVHTGQHYDAEMKHSFFEQLGIPEPDVDLEVGSGTHAIQTAEVMKRFEPVLDAERPSAILVVGDVNSTIACSLVAVKKNIPVIHVEAGLRSFDRAMPEEINRILTDQISDKLFTTEQEALVNLCNEGISEDKVHFVGNVMIDTLLKQLKSSIPAATTIGELYLSMNIDKTGFALLTLHRPSNVDSRDVLEGLLITIKTISESIPVVFPLHPRTRKQIELFNLGDIIQSANIIVKEPLGYHEMIGLMSRARVVLTDSGGIQEETTALGVPCITMRESTERPITCTQGTNTVVGIDTKKITSVFQDIMQSGGKKGKIPKYWDGKAAERIIMIIKTWLDTKYPETH